MLISRYINQFAELTPEAPAMIHNDQLLSYRAVSRAIAKTQRELVNCDLAARGTVAIMVPDLADCWVVTLALQARGFTTVCISSENVLGQLDIGDLVAVVVIAGQDADVVRNDSPVKWLAIPRPDFDARADVDEPDVSGATGVAEHAGHILYTSGTTGDYKKYRVRPSTQVERDAERTRYYSLDGNSRFHGLIFGLWTAIGYNMPPTLWSVGGCVLLDQRDDYISRFFDHGPTMAFLLPDMALNLAEESSAGFREAAMHSDPALYLCGGFVSNRVAQALRDKVSSNVLVMYGSSEVNAASFVQVYRTMEDLLWITPTGERVVQVVDDSGQVCPVGEEGRLRVGLTALDAHEYLDDPEASNTAFAGGYFYPGDMAVRREDGRFRILGRVADVMNLRGKKIPVAPLEANLQAILQLDYVCLFTGLDASGDAVIVVAMETQQPPDQDRLDHVGRELSQWGEVRFAFLAPFPRTLSGTSKIDRKRLRELVLPG